MSADPGFKAGSPAAQLRPLLRALEPGDLDAVIAIEESSYPFPWTRGIFAECLRVAYGCYGVQLGAELAGYCIHNWAAGESHLLNLCIARPWRERGLAGLLLDHAIDHARRQGCNAMLLEVRPSNPAAQAMYRHRGFQLIGTRPDYYRAEQGREDALVMRLSLE